MLRICRNINGQATVEAAIMIPVIFLIILILIQPCLVLFDLIIMNSAAIETCRVLSTAASVDKNSLCEQYARRRLSAIPQQENFHYHKDGCSYQFEFVGDQNSSFVSVEITNEIKPLPLINIFVDAFGMLNANKCLAIKSKQELSLKPSWVFKNPDNENVDKWIGKWF